MADGIAEQLLGRDQGASWCGELDPTGRVVCSRIRDHELDWHAGRRGDGGIQQWPVLAGGAPKAAVASDLRARCISALSEQVSEFISPNEFGGYDPHYGELVDIVLAEVRPVLERQRAEIDRIRAVVGAISDAQDKYELASLLKRRNQEYGRASETIGGLRAGQARDREALRAARTEVERATRHRAAAQGIVMYVVDTLGLSANAVGDAAVIGNALRQVTRERDKAQAALDNLRRLEKAVAEASGMPKKLASTDDLIHAVAWLVRQWNEARAAAEHQSFMRRYEQNAAHTDARPPVPADVTPRPAMVRAIADQLGRIAASQDMPFRQEIQDAADALAGRQGAPGSPWDQWLAPVSGSDTSPPDTFDPTQIVYCGSTEGYTGVDCQLEADHGKQPHEGRYIDPKNEDNWLFVQWPVSSGGDATTDTAGITWRAGDLALDRTDFVWWRDCAGWRPIARSQGPWMSDGDLGRFVGPLMRLAGLPPEMCDVGSVPGQVAARLRGNWQADVLSVRSSSDTSAAWQMDHDSDFPPAHLSHLPVLPPVSSDGDTDTTEASDV